MRILFVAGIGVAVFLLLLLISKKDKSQSDKILTVWMLLISAHLFLFYTYFTGDVFSFPFLLGTEHPLPLLHGVFLYFYVCSLTRQLPGRMWTLTFHFLPAVAMYAYLVPFFILPQEQKIQIYRDHGAGYEGFLLVKSIVIACAGIFYVIWSAILLRKHSNNIRDQFSDLEKINLRWLQILTVGMGCIWLLVILFWNDRLTYTGVVVFVVIIGFFGVRQSDIFTRGSFEPEPKEQKKKYPKSGLTEEASGELHKELIRIMEEDALYKKSDLSIDELSSRLGVHPNYLSQVINQSENKCFYDFVNLYRVEEFKRLIAMQKNRQYTLLALAYDCGFSSKSSFNRYFKKVTGQTPSQYSTLLSESE